MAKNDLREKSIIRLQFLYDTIPNLLTKIDDQLFSEKPSAEKWSKKEIIGHLIDSATNNHQRLVRVQFEDKPTIVYDKEKWNQYNFYQHISGEQIIAFWTTYNKQLIELIRQIPTNDLERECNVGDKFLTLEFLINDYVLHLEHHLRQVVSY